MLKSTPFNVLHNEEDGFMRRLFGDNMPTIPHSWKYTIENDIVEHNTLLGFILNAPMRRKIAVTAEDIAGLVKRGFEVEGIVRNGDTLTVPYTKNVISFEDVQGMSVYMSSGVIANNKKSVAWAEAGFPEPENFHYEG